ncbi:MAG: SbcC/MukB-like Walker B domain-containing protein, partial [Microbacterium sp.]
STLAHEAAQRTAALAERAWADGGGRADTDAAAAVEQLAGDLARWRTAADQEQELAGIEATLAGSAQRVAALDRALSELGRQEGTIPAERVAIDEALAVAESGAARRDDLQRERDALAAAADAAREAAALESTCAVAEAAHAEATRAVAHAHEDLAALFRRRLAGFAGELAAALVDGVPCAVCGSTQHPHPAEPAGAPVTDELVVAAESARDDAVAVERGAAAAVREVQSRRSDASARAGARRLDELTGLLDGVGSDLAAAEAAALECERLRARRDDLDARAAALAEERDRTAGSRAEAREQQTAAQTDADRLRSTVLAARGGHTSVAERVAQTTADLHRARALAEARAALGEAARALTSARDDLDARRADSVFESADEAAAALLPDAELHELDALLVQYSAELTAARARLLDLQRGAAGEEAGEGGAADPVEIAQARLAAAQKAAAAADAARTVAIAAQRDAQNTATQLREVLLQVDDAASDVARAETAAAVVVRLADTVAGRPPNTMKMDLETFVLAAELEDIVAAANVRLVEMSSGRYSLHHTDARAARGAASGLGIEVLDSHTGRRRTPDSLSGGETFLASLALALGLGEVVTGRAGGIRLDTLFVDEGFGSLDPETLEFAMRTLDELRAGGRTVGLISHVEAMKEQVPAQLVVEASVEGPSMIALTQR